MHIEAPMTFDQLLTKPDLPTSRFLLHPTSTQQVAIPSRSGVVLAVGPEGGFTNDELDKATANRWATMSLGKSILRIETAAVAAVVWATHATG